MVGKHASLLLSVLLSRVLPARAHSGELCPGVQCACFDNNYSERSSAGSIGPAATAFPAIYVTF